MTTEARKLDHAPSLVMDEREHASEDQDSAPSNSGDARRKQIAVAAYYKAEQRGFEGNRELDDWLEAEKRIDSLAAGAGAKNEASRLSSGESVVMPGNTELEPRQEAGERIESDEVKRWAQELDVPAPRLRQAIKRVGPLVEEVKRFLANPANR